MLIFHFFTLIFYVECEKYKYNANGQAFEIYMINNNKKKGETFI